PLFSVAPTDRPVAPLFPYSTLFRSLVVGGAGALAAAAGYTSLRRAAQRELPPALSVFALSLVMLAGTAVTAQAWTTPTVSELARSEEHTSELQSLTNLVCRPLLAQI